MKTKKHSKPIHLMFIMVMVASIYGQTASASEDNLKADTLNSLGLFLGTDAGYELEKQVTRTEAAIMLVRLLGMEKEAQNGNYSHPFTDVPAWADKYIAYMYSNSLTRGVSDEEFDPDGLCNLQMYSAFVLRSLGFEDGSDFTYGTAIKAAGQLGLLDTITHTFLRGDMVAVSYSALSTKFKNSDHTMLDKLVADGAVDAKAAEPVQQLFAGIVTNESAAITNDSLIDNYGVEDARIKLTFGNEEVIVNMYDNPTSRDFLTRLPLTLTFEDYAETEKIVYLDNKLSTEDASSGSDPSVGDFAYFSPWGNLVLYYKDFGYSNGLIMLGKIESGMEELAEKLRNMSGDFTVKIEKME
ncbi:cyclophilin-like fold protein [Cohnella sp.]|uniref:cyclophilin-like fold protein n=1 Tax=Cohnella sp. TaxID=1883426 RepID=UPI0035687C9E